MPTPLLRALVMMIAPSIAAVTMSGTVADTQKASIRLRATVDGVPWGGDSGFVGVARLCLVDSVLTAYATKVMPGDSSETIHLAIGDVVGTGNYSLDFSGDRQQGGSFRISVGDLRKSGWRLKTFVAGPSIANLTRLDRGAHTVSGTFSFTAQPQPVFIDLRRDSTGKMSMFKRDSAGRPIMPFDSAGRLIKLKAEGEPVVITDGTFSGTFDPVPEKCRGAVRL